MNNFCPNCGKPLEPNSNFCPYCRMQLNQISINNNQIQTNQPPTPKPDGISTAGFIISMISMFISIFGLISLIGLIISCVGLSQTPKEDRKGRDRAIWGIILGIVGIVWGICMLRLVIEFYYPVY